MEKWLFLMFIFLVEGAVGTKEEYVQMVREEYPDLVPLFEKLSVEELEEVYNVQGAGARGFEFRCDVETSPTVPTSVHQLRPSDVKAVAALGDSLSAGFGAGAGTLAGLANNYRGMVWSAGNDDTVHEIATFPNILEEFNPHLKGASSGVGSHHTYLANLNVAVSGARSRNMPAQAMELVRRLRLGVGGVDFNNDWKVITLFIGGNDLCAWCSNPTDHSPELYVQYIQDALDILHREVPRALVNLVACLDVTQLAKLNMASARCALIHLFVCSCGAYGGDESLQKVKETQNSYNRLLKELAESGRYDTRSDFTVVYQPFYENTPIPEDDDGIADDSYMAPDCFHFSQKGQEGTGVALWNNMVQPVGKKVSAYFLEDAKMDCPTKI